MISKFVTVYPGHIDMPDMGQDATPANDRNFTNDQLVGVFEKTEAIARQMDKWLLHVAPILSKHVKLDGPAETSSNLPAVEANPIRASVEAGTSNVPATEEIMRLSRFARIPRTGGCSPPSKSEARRCTPHASHCWQSIRYATMLKKGERKPRYGAGP
jgi:hypothetical protein